MTSINSIRYTRAGLLAGLDLDPAVFSALEAEGVVTPAEDGTFDPIGACVAIAGHCARVAAERERQRDVVVGALLEIGVALGDLRDLPARVGLRRRDREPVGTAIAVVMDQCGAALQRANEVLSGGSHGR